MKTNMKSGLTLSVMIALISAACESSAAKSNAPAPVTVLAPTTQAPAAQTAATAQTDAQAAVNVSGQVTPTLASAPLASSPSAAQFVQLTSGGCCVQPFFSPDDKQVLYLDKPAPDASVGIYGVSIAQPLAAPALFTEMLGPFSRDMSLAVDLENNQTVVRKRVDNTRWVINNGGRSVSFAPDNQHIAWNVSQNSGNFDVRRSEIWVANPDGSAAKRVLTRYGGGIQGWLNDSQHILVGGRTARGDANATLSIFDLRDGSTRDLFSGDRMRGFSLSPDDHWIAFFIAQSRQPETNGMYLMRLDTGSDQPVQPQRLDWFGAYRWRNAKQLLYVPLKLGAPSDELWQLDVETGQSTVLLPASADSRFKIGNGDWDVSGDGKHVIFVNAQDHNIWMANLP